MTNANNSYDEKLKSAAYDSVVLLHDFNMWRSVHPDDIVFILEGNEDYTFYSVMLKKVFHNISLENISPYMVKGKDNVLKLYHELNFNIQEKFKGVLFFIDKDFDDQKKNIINDKLYITPTYSIENLLVNEKALKELLKAEYCCNDENAHDDIQTIINLFKKLLINFQTSNLLKKANHILYYVRCKKIRKNNIQKNICKLIKISLNGEIEEVEFDQKFYDFLGLKKEIANEELDVVLKEFEKLDPLREWRGKFIFQIFIKFLSLIKEDRGNKTPVYFKNKKTVTFSPQSDIIRHLTDTTDCPECLNNFFQKNSKFFYNKSID